MNFIQKINFKIIGLHLIFWVAVWFFFFYFFSYNTERTAYALWFSSGLLPLTIALTYFVNYKLVPDFLLKKKYWHLALYSFYALVFTSYIVALLLYTCLIFILHFNISLMPPMGKNFFFILLLVILVVSVISFVSILNQNFKTTSRNKELENKILNAQLQLKEQELHYLKRQIHPHFLFNTLNTIYGFALKQSTQTPDIILKLSNLLDYILYQVKKPQVSLSEEVEHIREYIELERIRFQDTLRVKFVAGAVDERIQVAPMLLIPFVENAFKHGCLVDDFLRIEITISVEKQRLEFEVRNSYISAANNGKNGGLGIENIKKRLELNYEGRFMLQHQVNENWFTARLVIDPL